MRKERNLSLGILLILVGVIVFLRMQGLVTLTLGNFFGKYWPLLLVIAGICIIFRKRWFGFTVLSAAMIFILISLISTPEADTVEFIHELPVFSDEMQLRLAFGAGNIQISKGDSAYAYRNVISSYEHEEPVFSLDDNILSENRQGNINTVQSKGDRWDIGLSPEIIYDLYLDYGAAKARFDLNGLKVRDLSISSGASESEIIFGDYPVNVKIETGVSELDLVFPKDANVRIIKEGALMSFDASDMSEEDDYYISSNYDENNDPIDIRIEAGIAKIRTRFY